VLVGLPRSHLSGIETAWLRPPCPICQSHSSRLAVVDEATATPAEATARVVQDGTVSQADGTRRLPLGSDLDPDCPPHAAGMLDERAGAVGVFLSRYVRPSAAVGWA
jgi:hypothetical protein